MRVLEGTLGVAMIALVLGYAIGLLIRRHRTRVREQEELGVPALARFVDIELTDPGSFGGGAPAARLTRRRDTVAYGYLAVVEEYVGPDALRPWCLLTVSLPGRVPFLVADNRDAFGRPDVPMPAPSRGELDDPGFDAHYAVGAEEEHLIARLMTGRVRSALVASSLQRLMLRDSSLYLRSADGVALDDDSMAWLTSVAEDVLSAMPAFLISMRAAAGARVPPARGEQPLPRGFYGLD